MNQPHLVPVTQAAVSWEFIHNTQDASQTLAVLLGALTKLSAPGSAIHDLATHALVIANTVSMRASEAADAIH